MRIRVPLLRTMLLGSALALMACASLPALTKPDEDRAQGIASKIQKAEEMGARECAPQQLAKAQASLAHARHEAQEARFSIHERPYVEGFFKAAEASAADLTKAAAACGKPMPTASFTASPGTVDKGKCATLSWDVRNATDVSIDGIGRVQPTGSKSVCPSESTTYRMMATGPGGSKEATAAVAVTPPPPPTASVTANPATVKQGRCVTLTWSATNASKVSIDPGIGPVDPSGSRLVCPESTTQYTITVAGDGGSRSASTTVSVTPRSPKTMVFPAASMFDFDKADLKPEGKEQIKEYRDKAKDELSRADKVIITGHTDNVGKPDYNMKLSLRRAEAVRDYLVSLGADPGKMEVKGEGEANPTADNSTAEGRAKNRRVEVEVIGIEK